MQESLTTVRQRLVGGLCDFFLDHLHQIKDSKRLANRRATTPDVFFGDISYYRSVRSTAATNTSCPYSFLYYSCLISEPGRPYFKTVKQKYLAQDLCLHLAIMCRQYNDYGSIARDRMEKNPNSVDFQEFEDDATATADVDETSLEDRQEAKKKTLMWLAEYERECLNVARRRLEREVLAAVTDSLDLFINVTDLYGQSYVARDIASHRTID